MCNEEVLSRKGILGSKAKIWWEASRRILKFLQNKLIKYIDFFFFCNIDAKECPVIIHILINLSFFLLPNITCWHAIILREKCIFYNYSHLFSWLLLRHFHEGPKFLPTSGLHAPLHRLIFFFSSLLESCREKASLARHC